MNRRRALLGLCLAAVLLAGCARGPSTRQEVCEDFDTLGTRLAHANGLWDNAIFHSAGDLGDSAGRYQERDLRRDAEALGRIADSDSTSGMALMNATGQVADLCGHPLALNAMLGS